MTAVTGEMKFTFHTILDNHPYDIWSSPLGYVVPFAQFQKFLDAFGDKLTRHNDALENYSNEYKTSTQTFEETCDYLENRYKGSVKKMTEEMNGLKIAIVAISIIAIALAIILIVVVL